MSSKYNRTEYAHGQKINFCTYINEEAPKNGYARRARFKCRCGKEFIANISDLKRKRSSSCGCLTNKSFNIKHGCTKTTEYRTWNAIKNRCLNSKVPSYVYYGARGIKICGRWRNSFENFLADMGEKPTLKHSIDRINTNGNYSCGNCDECIKNGWILNCRWATITDQNRNMRTNRIITYNGESMLMIDWCRRLGIGHKAFEYRLKKWPVEKAITTPLFKRGKYPRR